jgi:hypothetical protein
MTTNQNPMPPPGYAAIRVGQVRDGDLVYQQNPPGWVPAGATIIGNNARCYGGIARLTNGNSATTPGETGPRQAAVN